MNQSAFAVRLVSPAEELDEERTLVADALKDSGAAGRLFDKYYADIFGYIYRSTLNRALTEDLTSNVFLSAIRHLRLFRWRRVPFGAWLYRIATNEIRMHYRQQRRWLTSSGIPNMELASDAPTASEALAVTENYRLLHGALLELPSKYRTALQFRYFEAKSIEEISAITGRTQGTVKSQLHRGLARLQTIFERMGGAAR